MTRSACAIVLAAGAGRRMGHDKALLDVSGQLTVELARSALLEGGCREIVIVRAEGAGALPESVTSDSRVRVVTIAPGQDMVESVRTGVTSLPDAAESVVVLPVDHALVAPATVAAVLGKLLTAAKGIVLPLHFGKPGHPIGLLVTVAREVLTASTLRDVIRRDPARVATIAVDDPFVVSDLDTPEDLARARLTIRSAKLTAIELMRNHRSRRTYGSKPVEPESIEAIVDAARYASTSSGMQAYSVVVVRDATRKSEVARLCADQRHVHEAPVFLAVCADLHKIAAACAKAGKTLQAGGLEIFLQSTIDAALVGQNIALAAESLGLGICMIGAARNHPIALAKLLGLPRHVYVAFGMTLGVPEDDPIPRGRMPLSGILHEDGYAASAIAPALSGMDARIQEWARATNRDRGGYQGRLVDEHRGWCERMSKLWGEAGGAKSRAHLRDELRELGFEL